MQEDNWQGTPQEYLSLWIKNNPDKLFRKSKERWEELEEENYKKRCDKESFFAKPTEPKKKDDGTTK